MSSTHSVEIQCDSCGKKDANSTGSYTRDNWIKISIEYIDYAGGKINFDRDNRHDYCPDCLDKHGRSGLLAISAKKAQR